MRPNTLKTAKFMSEKLINGLKYRISPKGNEISLRVESAINLCLLSMGLLILKLLQLFTGLVKGSEREDGLK